MGIAADAAEGKKRTNNNGLMGDGGPKWADERATKEGRLLYAGVCDTGQLVAGEPLLPARARFLSGVCGES